MDRQKRIDNGYRNLTRHLYPVGAPFMTMSPQVFDKLYLVWPDDLKSLATAQPELRKALAYKRYGLLDAPWDNGGAPLGFILDNQGRMQASCLLCHAGSVAGQILIGRANSRLNLDVLYEDVVAYRTRYGVKSDLTFMERIIYNQAVKELGAAGAIDSSRGNFSVMSVITFFMSMRTSSLNRIPRVLFPKKYGPQSNAYLDPAPWWTTARKSRVFSDAFAPKNPRTPILAGISITVSGNEIRDVWSGEFQDILKYTDSLRPPRYPGPVNHVLANQGENLFQQNCTSCHGTPGYGNEYPGRVVPIKVIGTDANRLDALSVSYKKDVRNSWLGYYGKADIDVTPAKGYIAPPLDGIWASAPYFHNGSVPSLYHVLNPDERPVVWRVTDYEGFDFRKVGFPTEELSQMQSGLNPSQRREYYNTQSTKLGKTNTGHRFADHLTKQEREAVLEYLKTL